MPSKRELAHNRGSFLRPIVFDGLLRGLIKKRIWKNAQDCISDRYRLGHHYQPAHHPDRIGRYLGLLVREMFGCLSKGGWQKLQQIL
jgi:hypothetical protein